MALSGKTFSRWPVMFFLCSKKKASGTVRSAMIVLSSMCRISLENKPDVRSCIDILCLHKKNVQCTTTSRVESRANRSFVDRLEFGSRSIVLSLARSPCFSLARPHLPRRYLSELSRSMARSPVSIVVRTYRWPKRRPMLGHYQHVTFISAGTALAWPSTDREKKTRKSTPMANVASCNWCRARWTSLAM